MSQKLKSFVMGKKVLLVLGNVWTATQLTALLPTELEAGSAVIVTCRNNSLNCKIWTEVRACLHLRREQVTWMIDMLKMKFISWA